MTTQTLTLPHGKHQGKRLTDVLASDPGYVEWLATDMTPRSPQGRQLQAAAQALLHGNGASDAPAAEEDRSRPRIYSEITRSAILHLEDALAIGKVRVFLLSYTRGQGASATVSHYLDVADARVLAADLAAGRLADKFVDYKGSAPTNGDPPLSRVLKLEDRGADQRAPIVLQVSNGPGQVVGEGAVKPAGKPSAEIAILLTRWQARRLGCALQAYLQASEMANLASRTAK